MHEISAGAGPHIIYQRDPYQTTIQADCDSIVVEKKVPVYITKQVWGTNPHYKTATMVLLGLLGAAIIAYIFTYKFQLALTKRSNGTDR